MSSYGWRKQNAHVACWSLGFNRGATDDTIDYMRRREFEPASPSTPIHLDNVGCGSYDSHLMGCRYITATRYCTHEQDAAIKCNVDREGEQSVVFIESTSEESSRVYKEGQTTEVWIARDVATDEDLVVNINVAGTKHYISSDDIVDESEFLSHEAFTFVPSTFGPRTVTIPAGRSRVAITVGKLDDDVLESSGRQRAVSVQLIEGTDYTLGANTRLDTKFRSGSYAVPGDTNSGFNRNGDDVYVEFVDCGGTDIIQESAGTHEVKLHARNVVHGGPATGWGWTAK